MIGIHFLAYPDRIDRWYYINFLVYQKKSIHNSVQREAQATVIRDLLNTIFNENGDHVIVLGDINGKKLYIYVSKKNRL